ncbi:hypothetical protein SO694_00033111 [Aureococcus anophagefferens]|uniref:Uncharacterized protein n=1 Tax=Aureococcus anophagefferens TaxID=44056 RepID=A0ABR1FK70_AURAN
MLIKRVVTERAKDDGGDGGGGGGGGRRPCKWEKKPSARARSASCTRRTSPASPFSGTPGPVHNFDDEMKTPTTLR